MRPYPVARDVMTFLFDRGKALDALHKLEAGWGGTAQERMAKRYAAFAAQYGSTAPKVSEQAAEDTVSPGDAAPAPPQQPMVRAAQSPPPEPDAGTPPPSSTPATPPGGTPPR